jgi:leucyl-tRNA synthetase
VIEIPVQINGKVRGRVEVESGMPEEKVKRIVLEDDRIGGLVKDRDIKKFIYIDGKIVNIVV